MNGIDRTSSTRRWTALALQGFASGLPLALSGDLLSAWLVDAKFDLTKIGMLGLVGLPYTLKFIWSPLADRYTPPFLGRRRGWMVISQLLLIAAILVMAQADPRHSLTFLFAAATSVAFFSATQDIVVDAWRADVLALNQRGPGAAVSVAAYRLGMVVSGAGALIFVGRFHISWPAACRLTAAAMVSGIAGALLAEEPAVTARPRSLADAVARPLEHLLTRPRGVLILLFVLIFKLPENLANGMSLPFLLSIGFPKEQIGEIRQGLGVAVTIAGALAGGGVVRRLGIWRSLWVFGLLHSVSNLAFVALAKIGPGGWALASVIVVENLCIGLTTAGFIAWMIGQCESGFSAFEFALLSGVMALGRVMAIPLSGWMARELGWTQFFAVSALCGVPGLLLLPWLKPGQNPPGDLVTTQERAQLTATCPAPL